MSTMQIMVDKTAVWCDNCRRGVRVRERRTFSAVTMGAAVILASMEV